jgi:hypothetical protein
VGRGCLGIQVRQNRVILIDVMLIYNFGFRQSGSMGQSARYCTRSTRLVLESVDILRWSARTSICVDGLYFGSKFSFVHLVLHWHAFFYDRD